MALHGAPVEVADIDLLTSLADAERLFGDRLAPPPASPLFRSARFARWEAAGFRIELMAGLRIYHARAWQPVAIEGRVEVRLGAVSVYTPGVDGLLALCRLFDRPKDRARAALLEDLLASPTGDR